MFDGEIYIEIAKDAERPFFVKNFGNECEGIGYSF